jgi:hypothetical protein
MGSWKIKKRIGTPIEGCYKQKSFLGGWVRNNRPLCSTIALGCAMLVASPSWATTVEPGYGDLTINQGKGFKPVTSRINANVGDSVMVGPSGAAIVLYDDGCKVSVQPGAVTTIAPLSPCAAGSNAADMGVPPPAPGPSYYPNCTPQPDGSLYCHPDWALIALGVGAAAALGVGIWALTNLKSSSGPASP